MKGIYTYHNMGWGQGTLRLADLTINRHDLETPKDHISPKMVSWDNPPEKPFLSKKSEIISAHALNLKSRNISEALSRRL